MEALSMVGSGGVYSWPAALLVAAIVVSASVRWWGIKRQPTTTESKARLPRGSLGWPVVGETLAFISAAYSAQPESFVDKRRLLYGKVFKSHLWGSKAVVSSDAEVSRAVLQADASAFVPWYPSSLMQLMGESSILVLGGGLQRRVHGLAGAFFKSPQLKARLTVDMQRRVADAMDAWQCHGVVRVQDEAKSIVFEILVKALIGLEPGQEMHYLKQQFREFIAGLISLPIKLPGTQLYRSIQEENMELKKRKSAVGGTLEWTDYMSLAFTQHVITETLRIGNIINGIMRKAVKDVEVKGQLLIPQGWCVFLYFRSVHLDGHIYDDPYAFNPWRWKERDMMAASSGFTPFGGGQRLCPGVDLARLEASIFLHHLVTTFRWEAEDDTVVTFPTVRLKRGMPIRVSQNIETSGTATFRSTESASV
ncbi:hypothetical protein BRADI_2g33050v3 [Brachypodium distachyon]|uniref:Cytochrome P450 n=1 Tax=Brachypodium distachyon TaxID=15368 RepID=A0A0Q3MS11_BRADI|nr:hypothetical protein BRADI_2g33050v3 [Brachypodium distachyon]